MPNSLACPFLIVTQKKYIASTLLGCQAVSERKTEGESRTLPPLGNKRSSIPRRALLERGW